jgi:hypothetical protein
VEWSVNCLGKETIPIAGRMSAKLLVAHIKIKLKNLMDFIGWISLDGFHWVGWLKETLQIKDAINGSSLVGKPWVPVYTTGILPRNRRKNRCDSASFP